MLLIFLDTTKAKNSSLRRFSQEIKIMNNAFEAHVAVLFDHNIHILWIFPQRNAVRKQKIKIKLLYF